jgi:EAL and modified HD-GYP domain-containing signal transduction protein
VETYIARQPIFDLHKRVYGYELLFRSGLDNIFKQEDPDQASSQVIIDSFFLHNISALTGRKRAFINVTRDLLLKEYLLLIPRQLVVVEILENIDPDSEVIAACKKLKKAGYLLAMDDFVYGEKYKPFMDLADFIKIDFLSTAEKERKSLPQNFSPLGIGFLAEKVETPATFQEALESGYTYFQGNFFSKPTIIPGKDLPGYKLHYFRIIQEINRPEISFERLEELIKKEISLSYKLFRYINSAFFGLKNKVHSIQHAMALLGEKEVKKWLSFITLATIGEDKPEELAVQAIIRARFCESLAPHVGLPSRADGLFLMGMFSLLDAFLDRPLSDLLMEIPLDTDIKKALLGEENRFGELYQCVLDYERGEWSKLSEHGKKFKITEALLSQLYLGAVEWASIPFQ